MRLRLQVEVLQVLQSNAFDCNLNKKLNKNKLKTKTIIDSQNNKQITKRMCDILSMTTETYCKYKRSFT